MDYALSEYRFEGRKHQSSRWRKSDSRVNQSQLPNPVCMLVMTDANVFPEVGVPFWAYLDAWTSIAMGE